jgi:hypothetical protein
MSRVTLIALLAILSFCVSAQTIIPWGNVSGHWTQEEGPYYIQGNISIDENDSLIIDAGVKVIFMDNYSFPVFGYLEALGNATDSIYFTVADTTGFSAGNHMGWSGLNVIIYPAKAKLDYCVVEYSSGDGIVLMDSELQITNSTVRKNSGNGINCWNSMAAISDIEISQNFSDGIIIDGFQEVILQNYTISNNLGYGLVTSQHQGLVASNGLVSGNAMSGLRIDFESNPIFSDITIENNGNEIYNGGGIYATGGFTMNNATIKNNTALSGGGIYYMAYGGEDMEMENSLIEGNNAAMEGGGIYLNCGELNLNASVINNNTASNGGGIYFNDETFMGLNYFDRVEISENHATEKGGGIYFGRVYDNPSLNHLTIVNNIAGLAGNAIIYDLYDWNTVFIKNTIIWDNGDSQILDAFGKLNISNSDVEGGWIGEENLNEDPRFNDMSNGNYSLQWNNYPANNFGKSPCIDAGDPASMLDPDNTIADIGAYYFDQTNQGPPQKQVQIKVLLQGPFVGSLMQTALNQNDLLPLAQPYNTAPWNYPGEETVSEIPSSAIVDWVLIEFRDATDAASADGSTIVETQAAFLLDDGKVVALDGISNLTIKTEISNELFVVIRHRNHLSVMNANVAAEIDNGFTFDFTVSPTETFAGHLSMHNLGNGLWGMIAADANGNGQINNVDKVDCWAGQFLNAGYLSGDFNMDSQVDMNDKTQAWNLNSGKKCHIPQ